MILLDSTTQYLVNFGLDIAIGLIIAIVVLIVILSKKR